MNTIELRTNLHGLIDTIDDFNILQAVQILLDKQARAKMNVQSDFWLDIPDEIRVGIQEGIEQSDKGEVVPHDEVIKLFYEKI